jgi:hypothetical protein
MEWANDRVLDPKVLNKGNKKTGGHSPYNRSTQCLCPKASWKSESLALAVAILVWNTWNSLSTVHFSSPSLSTDSCPSSTDREKKKTFHTFCYFSLVSSFSFYLSTFIKHWIFKLETPEKRDAS